MDKSCLPESLRSKINEMPVYDEMNAQFLSYAGIFHFHGFISGRS